MDATNVFWQMFALLCLAIVFCPLELLFKAIKDQPLWRKKQTPTDILHWILTPLVAKPLSSAVLTWLAAFIYLVQGKTFHEMNTNGFGPVILQPTWLIVIEMLLLTDLMGYWRHRIMHSNLFWKTHAVHHSSSELYWLSAVRFHPIDMVVQYLAYLVVIYFLGFPLSAIALYVPFVTLLNFFYHSNLDWSLGPLRYVVVTPPFHRWHHTLEGEGQGKNFSTIFSFYDLIFGTFYFAEGSRPRVFGISDDHEMPTDYFGQVLYPFRHWVAPWIKKANTNP